MKHILLILCLTLFVASCSKTDDTTDNTNTTLPEETMSATFEVTLLEITASSIFINSSFILNDATNSIVKYGAVYSQYESFNPNTAHNSLGELSENEPFAVELTSLKEGTTYFVKIYVESNNGDIAYSETQTYTTLSTDVADKNEVSFNINVEDVSSSSATISISFSLIGEDVLSFNASKVGILISESESLSSNAIYTLSYTPMFTISDLNSETTYYFKIFIEDNLGNRLFSEVHNFTTLTYTTPEPQSSIEVYLSDLSYYTYPDEDLWIIQDATIENTSVKESFGGMQDAVGQAKDDGRYVWLEFANLESLPQTTSSNPFYLSNILSISMPKATFIGAATFRLCSGLISVSIPSATEIEYGAFMQCESLIDIELNPDFYTLEDGVVYNGDKSIIHTYLYSNNSAEYTAPESVTFVTQSAFYCSEVTSITLPNVTKIDKSAMSTCKELISVSMPEVEELESSVFYNCTSLTSISAPKIKIIGKRAFEGCNESCTITIATDSEITSIADQTFETQTADEHPFYKTTLIIGSQNSKWVDVENNYLLDDNGYQHKFKEIILE